MKAAKKKAQVIPIKKPKAKAVKLAPPAKIKAKAPAAADFDLGLKKVPDAVTGKFVVRCFVPSADADASPVEMFLGVGAWLHNAGNAGTVFSSAAKATAAVGAFPPPGGEKAEVVPASKYFANSYSVTLKGVIRAVACIKGVAMPLKQSIAAERKLLANTLNVFRNARTVKVKTLAKAEKDWLKYVSNTLKLIKAADDRQAATERAMVAFESAIAAYDL